MDYQSNSRRSKEDIQLGKSRKQMEKVVTGEVIEKPKSVGHKFKDIFLGGDFKMTSKYVVADVLFPALRDMVFDAGAEGLKRLIYGESRFRRRTYENRSIVSYDRVPLNPTVIDARVREVRPNLPDQPSRYRTSAREIDNIILSSRAEAEQVLENLMEAIEQYDTASVGDLYDLLGKTTTPIDNKWGWTNLKRADIRQVREGYLIELPPIEVI